MFDFEKCVELAQQRLRDVIIAASKSDGEKMLSLMSTPMLNELPARMEWKDHNNRLVIGKYEFTIEEFITTDRYCLFGPMPDRELSDDEFEFVQNILRGKSTVVHWQFGPYSKEDLHLLEDAALKYLRADCLLDID
jgi:hypothetical protein